MNSNGRKVFFHRGRIETNIKRVCCKYFSQ
jgi:hypothetical protein